MMTLSEVRDRPDHVPLVQSHGGIVDKRPP